MRQLKITKQVTNRETASLDKYLQEIGKVDLITADEEVELAQRIKAGDQYASLYLKAFTENKCSSEVLGNATVAGALFLKLFTEHIDEVDRLNQCNSFSKCLNFWYNEREDLLRVAKAKNLTQSDISAGNGVYKGDEPTIARYVFVYNEYCRIKGLNHNKTYATAIPLGGEKWKNFVDSAPVWMQAGLTQMAGTQFVV